MGFRLLFSSVILALFVSACSGTRISSEIYLVDIDEIPEVDNMTVKVMIGLPISSQDECAEQRQRYNGVFSKSAGFKNMQFVRCFEEGYDDFAEYELEVPMRMADPFSSPMEGTFEVVRQDDGATGNRHLYLRSNPNALCNLDDLISDEFYRSLDLSNVSPKFIITNDLRQDQTLILDHVFVNQAPVIEPTEFVMERRDSLNIVLSDVTAAWVFNKSCKINSRTAPVGIWAS